MTKLSTLFLINFNAARNGAASNAENANFKAKPDIAPTVATIFPIPIVSAKPIPPKSARSIKNFLLNSFNLSTFPSDVSLKNDKVLSVNQPAVRMNKKLPNLLNIP